MKQSKTTLKELGHAYGRVMRKCALPLGLMLLFSAPAMAVVKVQSGENYLIDEDLKNHTEIIEKKDQDSPIIRNYAGTITIQENIVIENNTVKSTDAEFVHHAGVIRSETGAGYATDALVDIKDNVQFVGNRSGAASAIFLINSDSREDGNVARMTVGDNVLFRNNISSLEGRDDISQNGGAIMNASGEILFGERTRFIGNTAGSNGGALILYRYSSAPVATTSFEAGTQFMGNTAIRGLGGAIYLDGEMTFNGGVLFSGNHDRTGLNDIYNVGTLTFNGGNVSLDGGISGTGDIVFNDTTLTLKIRSSSDYTTVKAGKITLLGDSTLKFIFGANGLVGTEGPLFTYTDLDDDNGTMNFDMTNTLYDITFNGLDDKLTVTKKSSEAIASEIGANDNHMKVVDSLMNGAAASNAAFNKAADTVVSMLQHSDKNVREHGLKLAAAMAPASHPKSQHISNSNTSQVFNAAGTRLSSGAAMGRSSGDFQMGKSAVWAQGMMNKSELDDAFDAESFGVAVGIETNVSTSSKLGLGYAYTDTTVNPELGESKIDSHTILAYGEYKPSGWFLNGIVSYTFGSSEDDMIIRTADYNIDTFAAQAMTGYEFKANNSFKIAPMVGLRYIDATTEKHTDSLGNTTKESTNEFFTGIGGVKFAYGFDFGSALFTPELYLGVTYDFSASDIDASMVMANGSVVNVLGESLDEMGYEIGAGISVAANSALDISINYIGRIRKDYTDNTGMINLKYKF